MKKYKLLTGILMLIACFSVLAVGIYALIPAKNNIKGTITVVASNPEISIKAYYGSVADDNLIISAGPTRTGVDVDITHDLMKFETANKETAADVDVKKVVFVVTNNSGYDLGLYFATAADAVAAPTTGSLTVDGKTTEDSTTVEDVMEISFSGYAELPKNGSATMEMSFKLLKLLDEEYKVDLSDYTIYLNTDSPAN